MSVGVPRFGGAALWWAIPIAEAAETVYAILSLRRFGGLRRNVV